MATKKAKRAAGLARREAFLAAEAELGRQAIERGKIERHEKALESWKKSHEKHYVFEDACPHCATIKEEQTRQRAAAAMHRVGAPTKKQMEARLSRHPKAEIEGVDVLHPFAAKVGS